MKLDIKSISPTAILLDVDGIPVALDADNNTAFAFDTDPPRKFKAGVAAHNGYILSKAEFEALISLQGAHSESESRGKICKATTSRKTGATSRPRLRKAKVSSATSEDPIYSHGFVIGGKRLHGPKQSSEAETRDISKTPEKKQTTDPIAEAFVKALNAAALKSGKKDK